MNTEQELKLPFKRAIGEIVDTIGVGEASFIVEKSAETVYKWADKNQYPLPNLIQGVKLDSGCLIKSGLTPIATCHKSVLEALKPRTIFNSPEFNVLKLSEESGKLAGIVADQMSTGTMSTAQINNALEIVHEQRMRLDVIEGILTKRKGH